MYFLWILMSFSAVGNGVKFPEHFKFGVATAAYQVEGAWKDDGKGPNIWDEYTHRMPDRIVDRSNGDIATDSYHLYKRDIQMLKELGVHFYRFSISWSRLLPSGFANKINHAAYNYYSNLINDLLSEGIEPYITLYHWDLPQKLEDLGGLQNDAIIQYFEDYAFVAFSLFGERVKTWFTFNEPKMICEDGYGSARKAPALNITGIGNYLCIHNLLRAHAKVYHLYGNVFKDEQGGRIGMVVSTGWRQPRSASDVDKLAAEDAQEFNIGRIYDPVIFGDYPKLVKKYVGIRSMRQGFPRSRLPTFSEHEKLYMRNSVDFLGVNYYTARYAYRDGSEEHKYPVPSLEDDTGVSFGVDPSWPKSASSWLFDTPWGLRNVLNWLKNRYGNREIMITENGFSTRGGLQDDDRVKYLKEHLNTLLESIVEDRCNITAYTHWSLMDNFEWARGYTEKFGLYEVDFKHANRTRLPRKSAEEYRNIIKTRSIENDIPVLQQV